MPDGFGSTGLPDDLTGTPLISKVQGLVVQEAAMSAAQRVQGFVARQEAMGLRQGVDFSVPEVNVGALMDLGS